jgi:hypothetical protein
MSDPKITLDGKKISHYLDFSIEEGWVDIIDSFPAVDFNEEVSFESPKEVMFQSKRLFGKVELWNG